MKIRIKEKYNLTPETSPIDYADLLLPLTKKKHGKKKTILSAIEKLGKYEGITCRSSIIWCMLLGIQNLQPTVDPSPFGYLHIP